jgi:hypothetical protein
MHPLIARFMSDWVASHAEIEKAKSALHQTQHKAYEINHRYQIARLGYLKQQMAAHGLGWCSIAQHEVEVGKLALYLIDTSPSSLSSTGEHQIIHRACGYHLKPVNRRLSKAEAIERKAKGAQDMTWLSPYGAGIPHDLVLKYGLPYWDLPIVQPDDLTPTNPAD